MLLPILIFVALEVRNLAPDVKKWRIWSRVIGVVCIGLFYSLVTGLFFTHFISRDIIAYSGYIETFWERNLNSKDYQTRFIPCETDSAYSVAADILTDRGQGDKKRFYRSLY
ncbi:MAG: hypothetical protein U5R06_02180 [candidate division KSB1 bacterium]|nr:hypothetical protein [candidate division KSB1 bacterium]